MTSSDPTSSNMDSDGDGFDSTVDCDDTSPTVYPGAPELCNGVDDDCDGAVRADEADVDQDGRMVCSGDCDDDDDEIGFASAGCTALASETLGAEGGRATLLDVTIEIPPGALDTPLEISVRHNPTAVFPYVQWAGEFYTFEPAGTVFQTPIAVSIPYTPGVVANPVVVWSDTESPPWELPTILADTGTELVAEVSHFTVGGVGDPNDLDNDRYPGGLSGGPDCDDQDPTIHPGAVDLPGDGIDSNCDGVDGETDADHDDHSPPHDCDDQDPTIYPGAPEVCGNGIDEDCDLVPDDGCSGEMACDDQVDNDEDNDTDCADDDCSNHPWCADLDNDNISVAEGDCNDDDDTVYPGAAEICGNGIDDDCDGVDTPCGGLEVCDDSVDNDNDTDTDCDDADCAMHEQCMDQDYDQYTPAQGDCDDRDPTIHPAVVEVCNDGIDNNCDPSDDC